MSYTFPAEVAYDPAGNKPVKNVSFQVYATTDTAFTTPLAITDAFGTALPGNILNSGSQGVFPQFQASNSTVVIADSTKTYAWTVVSVSNDATTASFVSGTGSTPGAIDTLVGQKINTTGSASALAVKSEVTTGATSTALNATYATRSQATASLKVRTSSLTQKMLTAAVMPTPPTITTYTSLPPGYKDGANKNVSGWPNGTAVRPSGAPLAPPNQYSTTYPLGPDAAINIFDGSVHFDFDCPDQTFIFQAQLTSTGRFRIWADGAPHASAPVAFSTLGADSGLPVYIKVDFGSRSDGRKVSIEMEGVTPNATGTPLPFNGVWIENAGSIWPTSITSPRMVVLGDSYGKGIGATYANDAYPVRLGKLLGITDTHHFTCESSTGIIKGGTTNSYRTRLQPIIDAKADIIIYQGSINDAYLWPQYQGQIGPQFKLDIATLQAGLPNAVIIVTSPLEVRIATSAELAVRDELKAAVASVGLPFVDILGTQFFNGTGKVGSRTVTDGATTSGSTTITSSTASFNSGTDTGVFITGAGIPSGTTIASVTNATTAVLSAAATATATGVTLNITAQKGDGNGDYYLAPTSLDSAAAHPSSAGHLAIAKLLAGKIAPLIGVTSA